MTARTAAAPADGLYVHVPFCEALCSYCDFYSVARGDARGHRYVAALRAEADARLPTGFAPATVFIGGGTPTALSDADFDAVLGVLAGRLPAAAGIREWTVECNPNSLTREKVALMRAVGVTRLSIGVQSFDDRILRSVGRVHDAREAREAVALAREAGFRHVSIDLLFALPGQGLETFRHDLETAVGLGTDHVSAYALLYEAGTPLTRHLAAGRVVPEDEDQELAMLRAAHDTLGAAGFARYEVSNFARPGAECLHNLNYWRNGTYLGLGPAAVSYAQTGERRKTVASWRAWEAAVLAGEDPVESTERLGHWHAAGEELMLRLRLAEGACLGTVDGRWGTSLLSVLTPFLDRLAAAGLLEWERATETITLTSSGLEVADAVMAEILSLCRDAEREPTACAG